MKEKIIALLKEHAKDLGIKVIGLTGESLVKLANNLANTPVKYEIKSNFTDQEIKDLEKAMNAEPLRPY